MARTTLGALWLAAGAAVVTACSSVVVDDQPPVGGVDAGSDVDAGCSADDPAVECEECTPSCSNANGTTQCIDGVCVPTCSPGFGDCNAAPSDGCETDTTSTAHCGACGSACPQPPGGSAACEEGTCAFTCDAGLADCNGDAADGCEADTSAPAACGGCGNVCADLDGSEPTCSEGVCGFVCDVERANCNVDPGDGCEADLTSSPTDCGACGIACLSIGGMSGCVAGSCVIECSSGLADCNFDDADGCETDVATDPDTCGGCATQCVNPNGGVACVGGTCAPTCTAGYDDCDGNPNDGCETDLGTTDDCGGCGITCINPNGTTTCLGGVCVPTCSAGSEDCNGDVIDGCEAELDSSPTRCGACGHDCLGGGCTAGKCQPVVLASPGGIKLAIQAGEIFWSNEAVGGVRKVSTQGGILSVLVPAEVAHDPFGIAVDATRVYWTSWGGNPATGAVASVPIGGGAIVSLDPAAQDATSVVVDAANAYWSCLFAVCVVPLSGGSSQMFAAGYAVEIALDDDTVYWVGANLGDLLAKPKAGGPVLELATALPSPRNIVLDETSAYIAVADGVLKIPKAGGPAATLVSGQVQTWGLAVDATHLYWGSLGGIHRVPLEGGVPEKLADGMAHDIVVDDVAIYWPGANLMKLAKP